MSLQALLINPWIYDFACYDLFSKPIGFLQIASCLKKNEFKVSLIDCLDRLHPALSYYDTSTYGCGNYYYEVVEKPEIFKDIPRTYKCYGIPPRIFRELIEDIKQPDIILVTSGMTYWYKGVFEAIAILKEVFPKTPIILGGIYATLSFEYALKHSGADFVFKGSDFGQIVKLISKILNSGLRLDGSYFPCAYELYPRLDYISLRISSGCPFRCSYCGWYLLNPSISHRDPDDVLNELEYYYERLGIRNFAFYDDALFYNRDRYIMKILDALSKKDIKANFHTPNGLHARFLDKRLALLLRKNNFVQPRLGFETADSNRQNASGGKVNRKEMIDAVNSLKEAGYSSSDIGVYLLAGLPDQSIEEIEESIYFVHDLKVRVYIEEYSPVPGTVYYERSGLDKDADPLLHNNSAFPLYNPSKYSQFQRLKDLNHKLNKMI